jgi:ADP-ribose pyrophosphatase
MKHTVRQREVVYTGKAFKVEKVRLGLPDGRDGIYDLVNHIGSVTILPLSGQGDILFVRQYRIGSESELLELPAGTLNPGEDPLECAKREIQEETGMAAREFIQLGDIYLAPGYATEHMFLYMARDLFSSNAEGDEDEFIQVESIPARRAYEMADANEIHDSKTLAVMLLARQYLEEYLS